MDKLMELVTALIKTVLPPAARLIKTTAGMLLKGVGELGKLILPKAKAEAKKLAKKKAAKRGKRLLRKTAVLSGLVMVGSIAALIFLKKE